MFSQNVVVTNAPFLLTGYDYFHVSMPMPLAEIGLLLARSPHLIILVPMPFLIMLWRSNTVSFFLELTDDKHD